MIRPMGVLMTVAPDYEWPIPPVGGYTADDLDRLPNLPPHTELIDGSLVFMSPQTIFHSRTIDWLKVDLASAAPADLTAVREMTVVLGTQDRPEPDVLVVKATAMADESRTSFRADEVLLAVEVVSPDSVQRDRKAKPDKYAAAGIQYFWRVENEKGRVVIYLYELDPATKSYGLPVIQHERITTEVPFVVDIDLTAAGRKGR
jgi:Uma2 family endonuclease